MTKFRVKSRMHDEQVISMGRIDRRSPCAHGFRCLKLLYQGRGTNLELCPVDELEAKADGAEVLTVSSTCSNM